MKVLVMSDSHGFTANAVSAIKNESECQMIFFLGDGLSDIERCIMLFPEKKFICVKGNNDFHYDIDLDAYKYIEGNTIVASHGHKYNVRFSLSSLCDHASSVRANVVFYGHTHKTDFHYDHYHNIYIVNPGALCEGSYAVCELTKKGVEVSFKRTD